MVQRGLSSLWEQGESPEVLPGSLAPIQLPSNREADPLPGARPGCTAMPGTNPCSEPRAQTLPDRSCHAMERELGAMPGMPTAWA